MQKMAEQPDSADQEDQVVLAKHKNKLAQQRFRERQRVKKSNLANQIATLERRIAKLQTTHEDLELRNRSLEQLAAIIKAKHGRLQPDAHTIPEVCTLLLEKLFSPSLLSNVKYTLANLNYAG